MISGRIIVRYAVGIGVLFLRWWPPSSMWVGPWIFVSAITRDIWIIPSFLIWIDVLHVEHIPCVITNCDQYQRVIPSPFSIALLVLLEENVSRTLLSPFFQNFALPCCFPNIFTAIVLFSLFSSGWFVPVIWGRTYWGNELKFGVLMDRDRRQKSFDFGHLLYSCWFSYFVENFDLANLFKFGVSWHFIENAWKERLEIWYADISWPPERIWFWSWSVDFPTLDVNLTYRMGHICGFRAFMENTWQEWSEKENGGIFPTLCVESCLFVIGFRPVCWNFAITDTLFDIDYKLLFISGKESR